MERSKDWLDEVHGDLEHARNDMECGFHNWACFSAQQSAGKAIKAVFQRIRAEAWGHSVVDLLRELAKKQQRACIENAKVVSQFLGGWLDTEEMARVVEKSMYRQRKEKNTSMLH